jgi:hypothetical protein
LFLFKNSEELLLLLLLLLLFSFKIFFKASHAFLYSTPCLSLKKKIIIIKISFT